MAKRAPVAIFAILVIVLVAAAPETDVSLFFAPAAHLIAQGGDVYALHSAAMPFVYPPWVLPAFALYALPGAYLLAVLVNVGAAIWIVRVQRVSWWWLLYPPVLTAGWLGTFDLPVVALALLAYRRRNAALMALMLLIKPQAAIFWCVPLVIEQPRIVWRMAVVGAGVVCASLLLMPEAWGSWLAIVSVRPVGLATHYAVGGYSILSIAFGGVMVGTHGALARMGERRQRALVAFAVPFIRQYSAVGLIGYAGVWVIPLAWALIGLGMWRGIGALWVEPMVVLVVGGIVIEQRAHSLRGLKQ